MFDDPGRRQFLKLMGASLLLAGLTGLQRRDPLRPGTALRQSAGRDRARRRAVLRHGCPVRGLRPAGDRDDLRRPADQARRQSRPSGDQRRKRRRSCSRRSSVCMIRSARKSRCGKACHSTWSAFDGELAALRGALARTSGRRSSHPHRRDNLADPDPADGRRWPHSIPRCAGIAIRAGRHGAAGRGDGAGVRPRGHAALSARTMRRHRQPRSRSARPGPHQV